MLTPPGGKTKKRLRLKPCKHLLASRLAFRTDERSRARYLAERAVHYREYMPIIATSGMHHSLPPPDQYPEFVRKQVQEIANVQGPKFGRVNRFLGQMAHLLACFIPKQSLLFQAAGVSAQQWRASDVISWEVTAVIEAILCFIQYTDAPWQVVHSQATGPFAGDVSTMRREFINYANDFAKGLILPSGRNVTAPMVVENDYNNHLPAPHNHVPAPPSANQQNPQSRRGDRVSWFRGRRGRGGGRSEQHFQLQPKANGPHPNETKEDRKVCKFMNGLLSL